MRKFLDPFIAAVLKYPLLIIISTAVLTVAAALSIPKIHVDNSVDVFFNKRSPHYTDFQEWKDQFGSGQLIILAFKDDIFTYSNLSRIRRLTDRFEELKFVDKVTSLTNVNDIIGREDDFIVRRFIEIIPNDPDRLESLKKAALSNPLYVKNIVSEDGTSTAIVIELEDVKGSGDVYKKQTLDAVFAIAREEFPPDIKFHISGFTTIESFYALYMQNDLKTFMPIMLVVLVLVLFLSFRALWGILLPLLVTIISLIWTLSLLYLFGFSINNVTTLIPPVMLSITLLESIHFLWELCLASREKTEQEALKERDRLIEGSMRHLFKPCFLTNITTAVGFWALCVSQVPPLRQFGLTAGIGVLFAFVLTFTLLPAMLKQFNLLTKISSKGNKGILFRPDTSDVFFKRLAVFSVRRKRLIVIGSFILFISSAIFAFQIKTETSVIEYFRKDTPIFKATKFIEDNLGGVHFLTVSFQSPNDDFFKDPAVLKEVERLHVFLKEIPGVDKVTSPTDYLKEINKSFHNEDDSFYRLPDNSRLTSQYLLLYGADDLDDFVNPQWSWFSVQVRLKEHSTVRLKKIIESINEYIDQMPVDAQKQVLGQTVLEVDANEAVTSGQIQSLGLAMFLIFGMMFIDFRSLSLGFLSVLPNMLPIMLNFGIMGAAGIRLDSATSMISDIGIGIIVDDTIHFFHAYGEAYKQSGDPEAAIMQSFTFKGAPTFITSIILIAGFGVLTLSKFMPTFYFGLLSALLIFNGLWVELFLSPAILAFFKPKFK
ncbi:MAG: MMPL family transporter [Candidatus Omnitrophota bacterium]